MFWTFYIESEDGTRIYSTGTYASKIEAEGRGCDTVAEMVGGYKYLPATKMKWGAEQVK